MDTLFADMNPVVPAVEGLTYVPEFLQRPDEKALLNLIDAGPWDTHWQRRIQAYGDSYGFTAAAKPMPPWGEALAERLFREKLTPFLCDRMLVNEYLPGQGISPHVDYEPYDRTVVSISLGSACIMDFEHVDGVAKHQLWLEPRSALVMDGEARYRWTHGIAPRQKDIWNGAPFKRGRRVSVTFRRRRD
jgi:alkylated DNA repair dioxygenase AlkB